MFDSYLGSFAGIQLIENPHLAPGEVLMMGDKAVVRSIQEIERQLRDLPSTEIRKQSAQARQQTELEALPGFGSF